MYSTSHKEKLGSIQEFYLNHPANDLVSKASESLAELSFNGFCEYLGIQLTPDQLTINTLVDSQKQTNIVSCHGAGKSLFAAIKILYAVICKKGLGIVTAPTARQVRNIIFAEINRYYQKLKKNKKFQNKYGINLEKSVLVGHTFIREIEYSKQESRKMKFWYDPIECNEDFDTDIDEGLGYAFGFTAKSNDSNAFQGLHFPGYMLIIADEACGISTEITEAIEACATSIDNHILLIGNPISRGNPFEKAAKEQGCYRITCFSHPNVKPYYEEQGKDNWVLVDNSCLQKTYKPVIDGAVTPQWIESVRDKYGTNSLFWWTRVLAKFPRLGHGTGSLIPIEFVETACDTSTIALSQKQIEELALSPLLVGVDVGESKDPTVITIAQNIEYGNYKQSHIITLVRAIFSLETIGDGMQAERNYEFVKKTIENFLTSTYLTGNSVFISTDNTGLGVSLTRDLLKSHTFKVNPVHFAASPNTDKKTFLNIRAEMAWRLREGFLNGNIRFHSACLQENINQLKYEISGISYEQDPKTEKIKLLPKEDITAILGHSPNVFDSICLVAESNRFSKEN